MNELKIVETLNEIEDKKLKAKLALLFIEELGGNLTHIRNTGMAWGAGGEETRAEKEFIKHKKIIEELKDIIIEMI